MTTEKLFVSGTLAPGQENYHLIAHLGGYWAKGSCRGILNIKGWGMTHGYPGFIPACGVHCELNGGAVNSSRPLLCAACRADAASGQILTTGFTRADWALLDEFEVSEYERILVDVLFTPEEREVGGTSKAFVYAANRDIRQEVLQRLSSGD